MAELDPKVKKEVEDILEKMGVDPNSDLATRIFDYWNNLSGQEVGQVATEIQKIVIMFALGFVAMKALRTFGIKL